MKCNSSNDRFPGKEKHGNTYTFDSVSEKMKDGADRRALSIQMTINDRRACFFEFLRCSGRTMAT